jgi:hypothetical protein
LPSENCASHLNTEHSCKGPARQAGPTSGLTPPACCIIVRGLEDGPQMELLIPDILADVRQLSTSLPVLAFLVGAVLWLGGWWSHRFWVVLGFTVLGGIYGLQGAAALRTQPLVAAIGVGLAAGLLALTLVRLGAFVAGGYAGLLLIQAAFPALDQPLLSFLAGAFLGFVLFRYWTMALTSLAGVVLMGHAVLALADKMGKLNAVAWSEANASALTATCGFLALGGFFIQFVVDWLRQPRGGEGRGDKSAKKPKADSVFAAGLAAFRRAG